MERNYTKRKDVTMNTLKDNGYELVCLHGYYGPDEYPTPYTDQVSIDICTRMYVDACRKGHAIRFENVRVNDRLYRTTRAIGGWTAYNIVFAKQITEA